MVRTDCQPCTAGSYCADSGLTQPTGPCLAGYYCPAGTSTPTLPCPAGSLCPTGSASPVPCPAGTYQDETGQGSCKACLAGYYCALASPCPGVNSTSPQLCPPGYYCPNGTRFATEYPCPIGTYNNQSGLAAR